MTTTLGLDLGPNSIGWALIDDGQAAIINMGVRIFPEGVDNFDTAKERSRNEDRRVARGMRRQIARRVRRKQRLHQALIEAGLWPADSQQQAALETLDPYTLRAQAVNPNAPRLSCHELGRVILHLNQRRGFLSNRKDQAQDKETQGMLADISQLEKQLNGQTLGQYLASYAARLHNPNPADPACKEQVAQAHRQLTPQQRVRHRHTRRRMLEDELLRIAQRHSDVLTDQVLFGKLGRQPLKATQPRKQANIGSGLTPLQTFGIHGLMFFQRSLYWPKSSIGLCELEPHEQRCPKSDRRAQRFRLLQEVNNLRYIDPDTNTEHKLTSEQCSLLLEKLAAKDKMLFDGRGGIKAALGFLESVKFNMERGKRPGLRGHTTDHLMAKAIKRWHRLPDSDKDNIVRLLLDPKRDDEQVMQQLVNTHKLTAQEADQALAVQLPAGYVNLSLKAIERLLPHMERGLVYQMTDPTNSAIHAAGYIRRDQLQRRVFDRLPDLERIRDSRLGDIPNPVVRRTLVELRKLVNAIIREHGKPKAIHVEMARTVKQGERVRNDYNARIRQREAARDQAAGIIREHGIKVTRDAINRYLLWLEQEKQCVYTGNPISVAQLFNGDVDVDHILPYSRCLDDSLMNKVICFREDNAQKGQRTPYEWLAGRDPGQYEKVCQRAKNLPYPKYRRFLQKELELDKFIARQLVDTSYIASATAEYLRCLVEQPHDVLGLKGQLTAELRHQWGLNDLLDAQAIDVKSREDHRHHAIDALVVALTNRQRLGQLTRIRKAGGTRQTGQALELPWPDFRNHVEQQLAATHVSHRAARKVAGALHEETLYGQHRNDHGQTVPGEFVVRKKLEALSPNEVMLIRDPAVREAVIQRLSEHGIDVGRGKAVPNKEWQQALCDPENPVRLTGKKTARQGPPIHKVRVIRKEKTIQPIRCGQHQAFVKPGSTHHLSIFEFTENGKTKREAVWTTMLQAANRIKQQQQMLKQAKLQAEEKAGQKLSSRDPRVGRLMRSIATQVPLITRVHPQRPDARFLFSLCRGEIVLAEVDGRQELLVYNTSASTQGQIYFYHHADARPKSNKDKKRERKKFVFTANTLKARKVTVDYLGRIRWAND